MRVLKESYETFNVDSVGQITKDNRGLIHFDYTQNGKSYLVTRFTSGGYGWKLDGTFPVTPLIKPQELDNFLTNTGWINESNDDELIEEHLYTIMVYDRYGNKVDTVKEDHLISANSYDELFKKAYPYERQLRYMNGWITRFKDSHIESLYRKWLKSNLTIDLYYGGGVVD